MEMLAGVGREIITPELGTNLFGYAGNIIGIEIRDALTVTAAAFEYNGIKSMIISATLCLINTELSDEIRGKISGVTGVPEQNIMLSATHTHSGPSVQNYEGWGIINRDYCDKIFIPGCIKAAKDAVYSMKSVKMGAGSAESRVGINRREFTREGYIGLGQNPWGTYDPNMTVLSFKGTGDGIPVLNIIHYGAHCTAMGCNNLISRDWSGIMTDRLEAESGAVTMFINGTQGDTGPRLSNGQTCGNPELTAEIGALAAIDAVRIYKNIRTYRSAECSVISGKINIPFEPLMPLDEARRRIAEYETIPEHNLGRRIYTTLSKIIDMHERGDAGEKEFVMEQTSIRLGDAVFVPMPFETFSEISLRLRKFAPFEHVLVAACTNGDNSYLPTQDQLCRGGYEVEMFYWNRPRRLPDNTDTLIINNILNYLN